MCFSIPHCEESCVHGVLKIISCWLEIRAKLVLEAFSSVFCLLMYMQVLSCFLLFFFFLSFFILFGYISTLGYPTKFLTESEACCFASPKLI